LFASFPLKQNVIIFYPSPNITNISPPLNSNLTKITLDQQNADSSVPKMIEPLTTVLPTKPKNKSTSKSTNKKKKPLKKGESKVALSMSDLYGKENPIQATVADTTA